MQNIVTNIATNIDTVTATIRIVGERASLELSGEIERFDDVDVVSIASEYGYKIGHVVDECTFRLI